MRILAAAIFALALAAHAARAEDAPLAALPYTPGLDAGAMDRDAPPCMDFYQYACGGWIKANPIPADQASWDVFRKMGQDNQRFLWGILEGLANKTAARTPVQQKIGDYFAACMDEAAVEALGAAPLAPHLAAIGAMKSKRDLPALLAQLHLATGDGGLFFGFASNQDYSDSSRVIAFASAGGIGLPDRDYYLKDDEKSKAMREAYAAHVERIFALLGEGPGEAQADAATVMSIETELARASLTQVDRRDPYKLFHKMRFKALAALTPGFDWGAYLRALGLARAMPFNVTEPAFFEALARQLGERSLAEIKAYLRWHVTRASAPALSSAFVNESFAFFSKTLRGVPQLRARWKRCVAMVDNQLGEALGREFVRRAFGPGLKARTLRMTHRIEEAMRNDIAGLDWMGEATRRRAQEKLRAIVNKIGYPERWRDYSAVAVKRGDFFGNVERAQRFESRRDLAKIGKPLDRGEWFMTPPTVNAGYNPQTNDLTFPAGVLQPPLYDPRMDDAPNYGNTGATIGHELTHAFDDEGRKFDAKGNLVDWWTGKDSAAYEERAKCISDQYAQYVIVDDTRINSQLTLGEDVADLGGIILAWMAWKAETAGQRLVERDGLTPEQRFFVGNAQWACENDRPENQRVKALTDPHSPARYRVNGLVVNLPDFERAFACSPGQPMVAAKRCRVW